MLRATRYEVDLDIIAHNVRVVRNLLAQTAARATPLLAAVVKADAYGLGAIHVAEVLLYCGVDMLAVACLPEALELRAGYPDAPLLIMGHTPDEYIETAIGKNIALTVFDLHQSRLVSAAAKKYGTTALIHIKIDTGMNRLGIKPDGETSALLLAIASLPAIECKGIFTHLALCDRESDEAQVALFRRVLADAEKAGLRFKLAHVCDSIGMMRYPEFRMDMVRAGAVLFGVTPMNTPLSGSIDIRVPFALRTKISRLRALKPGEGVGYDYSWKAPQAGALLATLPIGYADGYKRCMANKATVIVRGEKAPVVGLVCMDQCTVDVSAVPGVIEGDEVLLLGQADGESVPVLELASWGGTNRNEILCAIGRRVPRLYRLNGRAHAERDYVLGGETVYES